MSPRTRLFPENVQNIPHDAIADTLVDGVPRILGQTAELLGGRLRRSRLADREAIHEQPPQRPQLVVGVPKGLRNVERGRPRRVRFGHGALRQQQRLRQRGGKLHLARWIPIGAARQACQCPFDALAPLLEE